MHLTLHLTTACNMRCAYCYSPPQPAGGMTEQVAQQALSLGARLTKDSCGIVFFGGEPLLHKELIANVITAAGQSAAVTQPAFHFKVTTNGLLLDEPFLEFAGEHDLLIAMSFDGIEPVQDRHRRLLDGAPSFTLLRRRLELLLEYSPYASVIVVVNPDTAQHLAESVTFLADLGVRYLIVSLNYAADWQATHFAMLEQQYQRLVEIYLEWTRQGRKFYLSPFEVKIASHIKGPDCCRDRCELAQRQISVSPTGHLFPCVQFTRAGSNSSWCIGHVSTGIDERALARIRTAAQRAKEPCHQCAIQCRCNHTCGCLNWQTTGSIHEVSPVLCQHEQLLLPIADRVAETLYRERNALFLHKHYNSAFPVLSLLEDALEA